MGELVTESKSDVGWKNAIVFKEHEGSMRDAPNRHSPSPSDIRKILVESQALIGTLSRPEINRIVSWEESKSADLDIDASLDIDPGLSQIMVVEKQSLNTEVVICMDTSLSMTGDKYRIASIAIACVAMQVGLENLGVICFDSQSHIIKRIGTNTPLEVVIRRFLSHQPLGLTNMESALRKAGSELQRGRTKRQHAIMVSDGRFTAGRRPDLVSHVVPTLHCIQTGSPWSRNRLYRRMATKANGQFLHVKDFADLPRKIYELARTISR